MKVPNSKDVLPLEQRVIDRIAKEFSATEKPSAIELLSNYSGPEGERVRCDILELSKGSLEKLRYYVETAQKDYRDILYWAEYYESDPMLRGRDPKKLVDDLLAKWGEKNR
jgi:hypothetical protein